MTDQPPVQPPVQPPHPPSGRPPASNPAASATQAMPSVAGTSPGGPPAPPVAPGTNVWRQATSTTGGRWAIGAAAGALAALMLFGVVVAGFVFLRGHDRVAMMGQRQDGYFRGQGDQDYGRGPGAGERARPPVPGMPGAPGMRGRDQGQGGLGNPLGGAALHGSVSATVNGSVQALVFQRGEVTALSATSLTLKSTDGFVGTYGLTAATVSKRAALVKGGQAFVLARASDKVAIRTTGTSASPGQ